MCANLSTSCIVLSLLSVSLSSCIDLGLVIAPRDQYVQQGMNITPQCEFASSTIRAITAIRYGQRTVETITNADIEDEGMYACDVTLISSQEATLVPFTLHVFSKFTKMIVNYT